MAEQGHRISAADGTALWVRDYLLPRADVRGSVVIMHGLGEHGGRYQHVARFFNDCGLSVRCYDHRGHGKSGGGRGDVIRGDPMVQDGEIVLDDFAAHFDDPPYLLGHSMGGLFAARFALARRSSLRGLMLSSPALAVRLSPVERVFLRIMESLAPFFGVPNGLKPTYLSHDPKVVSDYRNDPLVHNKISARLLRSMLDSIDYCTSHANSLSVATLMLVAGDDHLVDASGSERFSNLAPAGMVQMLRYPHAYHEVLNEPEAQRAFGDMRAWLATH